MSRLSLFTRCVALTLGAAVLSGCAAGVRLKDEPKAKAVASTKQSYADAKVLEIAAAERQNLERMLAEELKAVRDNNKIQIDFALLGIADDDTPMADTYALEAQERLGELGFAGAKQLRAALLARSGAQLRDRELADRAARIKRLAGIVPPECRPGVDLPPPAEMSWPAALAEDKREMANINYQSYSKACTKLNAEWDRVGKPSGKTKAALHAWEKAKAALNAHQQEVESLAGDVKEARRSYNAGLAEVNAAKGSGKKLEEELRKKARAALDALDQAKAALDKADSGVLAKENVASLITLLSAVAGDEIDTKDAEVKKAAELIGELPSLAGDMTALLQQARAPSVSNLLIEMRHQVLRMEYATQLRTLAKERVDILKAIYDAHLAEAGLWLEFTDAVCSFAVVSAGKPFPGKECDGFTVNIKPDPVECKLGGVALANCVLGKPWHQNIARQVNGDATREIYKALSAYVRALGSQSKQREQAFHLVDVKHRETLAARDSAIRSWNNLVETPIEQLDAYFASGITAAEIADVLVKAIGLTAIAIGVSQ